MTSQTRSAIRDAAQDVIDHLKEHLDYAYESTNQAFVQLLLMHYDLLNEISINMPDDTDARWLRSLKLMNDIKKWQSTPEHISTREMMETLARVVSSLQNWVYKDYSEFPPLPEDHPGSIKKAAEQILNDLEYVEIEELNL